MSTPETSDRHEFAVVWAPAGFSGTGDKRVSAGVEKSVRWESEPSFGSSRSQKGSETEADAKIVVGEDIEVGSIVWEGKSADLPTPVTDVTDLYEVVNFRKVPDVKGRQHRRFCLLKKWSDQLPAIV